MSVADIDNVLNTADRQAAARRAIMFPGQGAQYKGMGAELFDAFPDYVSGASEILGYSIKELCLNDPDGRLNQTRYTQPALYVVNALQYLSMARAGDVDADYFLGHSLGEYNALMAAGAFDFETGLRLVKKRGELMAGADGGAMAAVIGLNADQVAATFDECGVDDIDLANYNTPTQIVISGSAQSMDRVLPALEEKANRCVPLKVSAAFHSRHMESASREFSEYLSGFEFLSLEKTVIANATARPYGNDDVAPTLARQIASSVRWVDSIRFLMGQEVSDYVEVGSRILSNMVREIRKTETPLTAPPAKPADPVDDKTAPARGEPERIAEDAAGYSVQRPRPEGFSISAEALGSEDFRREYGLKFAYAAGAMYRGTASKELVVRMAKAGMMASLGTGGLPLQEIEQSIQYIRQHLQAGQSYGMNLLNQLDNPTLEMDTVRLYLKYDIRCVEAAAFIQMSAPLALYRIMGLRRNEDGSIRCENRVIAKVSRPEIAEGFMSPPSERIIEKLLQSGEISADQADMARKVPMSHDICVEADSGGHTDGGIATVLFPAMLALRDRVMRDNGYTTAIRMGLAGGIGTPVSAAAAFTMGADFVVTGSINQCTVEAGTSDAVKDLLQDINVQDTDYAPAGDMFEIGGRIQALKKGVFFTARANKLYALYNQYKSLDELPSNVKKQLEDRFFKKSLDAVWRETVEYFRANDGSETIDKADKNPKQKMALVFRYYFGYSTRLAFAGDESDKVNFQVHTGPALGAFNQWVKGTDLESWRNRHADEIGVRLMHGTAELLTERLSSMWQLSAARAGTT